MILSKTETENILKIADYFVSYYIKNNRINHLLAVEDVKSIAYAAIYLAFDTYENNKNCKLSTYVFEQVKNALLSTERDLYKRHKSPVYFESLNNSYYEDTLVCASQDLNNILEKENIKYMISNLDNDEKYVIIQKYYFDKSLTDISKTKKLTLSRISQIHSSALSKLKEKYI